MPRVFGERHFRGFFGVRRTQSEAGGSVVSAAVENTRYFGPLKSALGSVFLGSDTSFGLALGI